jgi:hypothetical protein
LWVGKPTEFSSTVSAAVKTPAARSRRRIANYRVVAGNPFLSGPGPDFLEGTLLLGGGIRVPAVATFGAKKAT